MKQALEALEEIADEVLSPYDNKLGDAIIALRAAIEQAQRNEFNPDWDALSVMVEEQQRMAKRIDELEAQQKPWVKTYAGGKPNYTVPEEQEPGVTLDASAPLVVQPHPAFKKWQGLTDEDREDILRWVEWKEVGSQPVAPQKLIAYVERKLREKNT